MFKRDVIIAAALCALTAPTLAAPQAELDALRAEFDQKFKDLQALASEKDLPELIVPEESLRLISLTAEDEAEKKRA